MRQKKGFVCIEFDARFYIYLSLNMILKWYVKEVDAIILGDMNAKFSLWASSVVGDKHGEYTVSTGLQGQPNHN